MGGGGNSKFLANARFIYSTTSMTAAMLGDLCTIQTVVSVSTVNVMYSFLSQFIKCHVFGLHSICIYFSSAHKLVMLEKCFVEVVVLANL